MTQGLQAGVATAIITPAVGTRMFGFGARPGPSESVRDQLQATALVVDDGNARAAILTCDLCVIHPSLLQRVRALVSATIGLPPQNLLVCCSHTHSGALTYVNPGGPEIDEAYVAHLPHLLAGAVVTAARQLQPARLRSGHATAHLGVHRRRRDEHGQIVLGENEAGPTDPSVSVLSVDSVDGRLLGTVVHYACHPVILGPQSLAISADYVGAMRRTVEEATGAPVLFVQGACADINPRGMKQIPEETLVETLGLVLAKAVFAARATAVPVVGVPVMTRATALQLPFAIGRSHLNPPVPLPALSPEAPVRAATSADLDERFPWSWEPVRDETSGQPAIGLEVGLVRCGAVVILGLSCEPFVEMGLAIKAASPIPHTMVAGYTNGCFGYLPLEYTYPEGGYEVDASSRWFRLPAPPQPGSAERATQAALTLLRAAAG